MTILERTCIHELPTYTIKGAKEYYSGQNCDHKSTAVVPSFFASFANHLRQCVANEGN
jgi:hypothetical protein